MGVTDETATVLESPQPVTIDPTARTTVVVAENWQRKFDLTKGRRH